MHSLRPYPGFGDIRRMVARSAYDQLNYSPLLLAGTVIGMLLTYLMPPLLAVFGTGLAQGGGALTWALMTVGVSIRLCASTGCRRFGPRRFLPSAAFIWYSRSTRRCSIGAAEAGFGKGACRRAVRRHHGNGAGLGPRREDASRREFSRRVGSRVQDSTGLRSWPSTASRAPPTMSRTIPCLPKRRRSARSMRSRRRCWGGMTRSSPCAAAARGDCGTRPFPETRARICSRPSAWTRASIATPIGTSLSIIAPIRPMPVGRFVLDVHGESRATWPANDALVHGASDHQSSCRIAAPITAASTASIFRSIRWRRGIIPSKRLAASKASPELAGLHPRACRENQDAAWRRRSLARQVKDLRLSLEVAAIERLARKLLHMLMRRDPLSEPVHLSKPAFAFNLIACGLHRHWTPPFFAAHIGSNRALRGIG